MAQHILTRFDRNKKSPVVRQKKASVPQPSRDRRPFVISLMVFIAASIEAPVNESNSLFC